MLMLCFFASDSSHSLTFYLLLVHSEKELDAVGAIEMLEERPRPHPPVDHRNFLPTVLH